MIKNNTKKVQRIYWIIALVLFGVFVACCVKAVWADRPQGSAEVVFLGDSIFAQVRDDTSVPRQVGALTDTEVVNCALGGTTAALGARPSEEKQAAEGYASAYMSSVLSMVALTEAMVQQDFGAQQAVQTRETALDYLLYTVDTIASIDFAKVDVLIFNHGINDYHAGTELTNPYDPYDEYTFTGAMRSTIEMLQEAYPRLRIIYVTPTYTWYHEQELTCEEYHTGYGCLEDYVDAALALCKEYDIETVDVYHDLYDRTAGEGYVRETADKYTADGIHPNELGRELIAGEIAGKLAEN